MRIESLNETHDVSDFACGDKGLDRYLRKYAVANARQGYGVTFVLTTDDRRVRSYYTLSNSRVDASSLPSADAVGAPRYPVPSVLLAKLAVHREAQGQGFGRVLLVDGLARFIPVGELSGARLFEVDALDEKVRAFYIAQGFRTLLDDPLHLFLTREDATRILGR